MSTCFNYYVIILSTLKYIRAKITFRTSIMRSQIGISVPPVRCTEQCTGEPNQRYQIVFFFLQVLLPYSGSWPPLTGLHDHSHWTHHTRQDSSGPAVSPTHRPLLTTQTVTRDRHPHPRRDLKPQSQQASGRRSAPWTSRPPKSELYKHV